jgi:hypothetical protein
VASSPLGKSNIDVFGSPFAEGGTVGNQLSDTEEVANSLRVKGRGFFLGEFCQMLDYFFKFVKF